MYPIEFVSEMITAGRHSELSDLLKDYSIKHLSSNAGQSASVFRFANAFLISVRHSLNTYADINTLDLDPIFCAWKSMGFFGIEYDDTYEYSSIAEFQGIQKRQ